MRARRGQPLGLRLPLSGVFALIMAGAVLVITLCMKGLAG